MKVQSKHTIDRLILSLMFWVLFCSSLYSQRDLKGEITTDGEITIGISVYTQELGIVTLSDINGEFILRDVPEGEFVLVVNPCCTCFNSTHILIKKDVMELGIECNCKRSKAEVTNKYLKNGKNKIRKEKVKL